MSHSPVVCLNLIPGFVKSTRKPHFFVLRPTLVAKQQEEKVQLWSRWRIIFKFVQPVLSKYFYSHAKSILKIQPFFLAFVNLYSENIHKHLNFISYGMYQHYFHYLHADYFPRLFCYYHNVGPSGLNILFQYIFFHTVENLILPKYRE